MDDILGLSLKEKSRMKARTKVQNT